MLPLASVLAVESQGIRLLQSSPVSVWRRPTACRCLRMRADGVCSRCFAGDIWPACDELVLQFAAVLCGSVDYSITIRVSDVFFVSTSLLALIAVMRHARHFLPRLHRLPSAIAHTAPATHMGSRWRRVGLGFCFVICFYVRPRHGCASGLGLRDFR